MIPFNHLGFVFKHFSHILYPKEVLEQLCEFIKELDDGSKVLDIGAGAGMMSESAHRCNTNLDYTAVDPAHGMLKYVDKRIKICVANAESLPFEDDSIDVVLMGESLHHFNDVELSLQEVKRVLKSGAKIFIYEFDLSTFRGKCLYLAEKIVGEPANFYKSQELKRVLEGYGFSVKLRHYGWRYTLVAIV